MKECHPDKFQGDETGLKAAEEKSNKSNWGLPFPSKYQSWNYKAELTRIHTTTPHQLQIISLLR
jgi:hypothetical protein